MIAKIAYEWYCARNYISGYHEEFANIVTFITTGQGDNPVTLIQDEKLYEFISSQASLGSHCLFGFCNSNNQINVVVFLFGIAMYRVVIAEQTSCYAINNFLFQELRTDSTRREVLETSSKEVARKVVSFINDAGNFDIHPLPHGMKAAICIEPPTTDIPLCMFLIDAIKVLAEGVFHEGTVPSEQISSILFHNIESITQASLLHKKSLGRFVSEHFKDGHQPIQINPNSGNKKLIFQLFVLMKIGESGIEKIDDKILNRFVKKTFETDSNNEITINDELIASLEAEMLARPDYSDLLERGAAIVKAWK